MSPAPFSTSEMTFGGQPTRHFQRLAGKAHKTCSGPEAVAYLSKSSSVPIYSTSQTQSRAAYDGGHYLHYQSLGLGSIMNFQEPTFWELYKWHEIGIAVFIVLETFLVLWLLFVRARRKNAESESQRFAAIAKAEHEKLNEVVASVPGIVWESRFVSGSGDRRIEFVSDYVETMLGYTSEEVESRPNFIMSVVFDEDREELIQATRAILAGEARRAHQFRCIAKDGRVIWIDAHLIATFDEAGAVKGIRGVAIDITDRKLAEENLRARELELTEAQRLSQIGSWEWDPDSDTVIWTEELYRIAGLDPSLRAPNFEQHPKFYTPESFERLASAVATAMESGKAYEMELELIRSDKEHRRVNARGEVVRDHASERIKLRGTVQDITDRKRAEQALSNSEERYRNVVETQTELICRFLPDTTLTFVNDAYCRYFGKTRTELIGSKFVDLIPSNARDAVLSHVASLVENPRTETYEHEVIQLNGSRGWQQWIDHVVEAPDGEPRELQGIGRDITDKRQAEEELRASENRFRTMADSAPLLIWMCGPDKLRNYVNQGWLDFTGSSLDMELGSGWTVGIHKEDIDRTSETFDSAFDRKEPFKMEYRLHGADGAFHWVYDSGAPRFSSDGEFLGYIGSCVDISERKEAEGALQAALQEVRQLQNQLNEENIYLKEVIKLEHNFDEIIGHSDALKYVLFRIEQVAPTDATVLITGETGTGKELVARAIHSASLRKNRPLVTVNCAALSPSLIESELFGHERGSFTGATSRKVGRFELADDATIFLDEIGELPMELQVKLLRVIEEGEFERLGSSKTIKVNVRIIAATNRNLKAEVENGTFRDDLLFRLNVFPITLPPLRERREDIPELIKHFIDRYAKNLGKHITGVTPPTLRTLSAYAWPGNIRELANVIERSVINTQGETLSILDLHDAPKSKSESEPSFETLETMERNYITTVLDKTNWRIEGASGAARILGLNPSTLRTRMAKLGISKKEGYRSAAH